MKFKKQNKLIGWFIEPALAEGGFAQMVMSNRD